jgi:hypothetical protein
MYVDASASWGIGIVIGDKWASFQLSQIWKAYGRDICWLETIAIKLLVYFLETLGFRDIHLLIHSDNQGTIGAFEKGRSANIHINLSICRTHLVLMDFLITPNIVYIKSEANLVDPILRGEPGPVGKCMVPIFTLLEELVDCFIHVQS